MYGEIGGRFFFGKNKTDVSREQLGFWVKQSNHNHLLQTPQLQRESYFKFSLRSGIDYLNYSKHY